jgi:hypothetical protein
LVIHQKNVNAIQQADTSIHPLADFFSGLGIVVLGHQKT